MKFLEGKLKIVYAGLLIILATLVVFLFITQKKEPPKKASLEFWGVYDDSSVWQPLIDKFNREHRNIKIVYRKKLFEDYQEELLNLMAAGRGPDIFYLKNTWLPLYQDKIQPLPLKMTNLKEYQDTFVDVVFDDFVLNERIYAFPLSVDTLALYYNKDIFNSVGISQPPQTWEEFVEDVKKITQLDEQGNIIRSGAAIGTAYNINRSVDILSLLMLQSGAKMVDLENNQAVFHEKTTVNNKTFSPGEKALEFYTNFANPLKPVYTWNNEMHYSIDAFYEEKTAMMFNYAYHLPTIKAKAPHLNFGIAPMPQIKNAPTKINYANYWGLTVSKNSPYPEEAWQFIYWLSQKENYQLYLELTHKPTARRDLIAWQKNDLDLNIFAEQTLTARSWYQKDAIAIENIFAEMIDNVITKGIDPTEAIKKAANQITLIMKK